MRHIISILLENESGALSRVAGLFSARGYNIEALTVAPTEDPTLSRMTLVTRGSVEIIEQITKQLNKLIDVVKLVDLTEGTHIEREMMLIKLRAERTMREEIKRLVHIFRGKIIDVTDTSYTVELTGATSKLNAFLEAVNEELIIEVVRTATFLFAAGQETTTKLLSAAMKVLVDRPDIAATLRANRSLIPTFIEESLRLESPVKSDFRLVRRSTTVGDMATPAGTIVMVLPGAVNRDPRRFDDPNEFRLDRPNVREHIAFGRGAHSCPGAPLARVEGRVSLERILDRLSDIVADEKHHGGTADRHYSYEPTFILRGLTELHIEFTPTN